MIRKLRPDEVNTEELGKKFDDYLRNEVKVTEKQYENITKDLGVFNVGGITGENGYSVMGGVNPAYAYHFVEFKEKHPEHFERELIPTHYDSHLTLYFNAPTVLENDTEIYNKKTNQNLTKEQYIIEIMFAELYKQIKENDPMSNEESYALIKEHNLNAQRFLYSLKGKKIDVSVHLFRDAFYKHLPEFEKDYKIQECFK